MDRPEEAKRAVPSAPFLLGLRVCLRSLTRGDLVHLPAWINDEEVNRLLFQGLVPAQEELLIEQWERDIRGEKTVVFAVCDQSSGEFIGTTGLYDVNWVFRHGEFRVFIGEKSFWGRGIGTECTKLMVVYGFEKLNLNKVWLGVVTENKAAVRAYEKAGFTKEGILRQEQYRNFRYYDVVRMSILREEYAKLREGYLD